MEPQDTQKLLKAVREIETAMFKVSDLAQDLDCGMSEEFCDKYPFQVSFDEFCLEVGMWRQSIERHLETASVK